MRRNKILLLFALLVAAAANAENFTVAVGDDRPDFPNECFFPASLTIHAGDSVTFYIYCETACGHAHNVVADDGSFRCAKGCDGEGGDGTPLFFESSWQFTRTFAHPGVVGYHDEATGIRGVIVVLSAPGAMVVEFHDAANDRYFITADPVEQAYVDSGAAGPWQRTGGAFKAGGPALVCRFAGNPAYNPATFLSWGPDSHFYTADAYECAAVKATFDPMTLGWKFEGTDFSTTAAGDDGCPASEVPVYRAYNNGFARRVDSNHRITADRAAYESMVARGWIGEGVVMCAPR
jgi:plastocyanin